jgi:hypothetical protein
VAAGACWLHVDKGNAAAISGLLCWACRAVQTFAVLALQVPAGYMWVKGDAPALLGVLCCRFVHVCHFVSAGACGLHVGEG